MDKIKYTNMEKLQAYVPYTESITVLFIRYRSQV